MVVCCTLQPDCSVMLQGLWSLAVFSFFLILFDVACMLTPSLRDKFIAIPIDVSQERPPACLGPVDQLRYSRPHRTTTGRNRAHLCSVRPKARAHSVCYLPHVSSHSASDCAAHACR